jgi:hypothetical protein
MAGGRMKKRIRFGEHYHWAANLLEHLDSDRFDYEFGPADPVRLAGVDVFVPLCLNDVRAMQQIGGPLSAKALVPTPELLALADHKSNFYRHLAAHGFGANVPQLFEAPTRYPVVAKKDLGDNGDGVWIVQSEAQLAALLQTQPRESLVFSEFIPGPREFAYHFLAKGGDIVWSGVVEHDHSDNGAAPYVRGQNGAVGDSSASSTTAELAVLRAVVAQLRFTGTGCFDGKVLDGTVKIFELNPRPGYSIALWLNQYLDALLTHLT